MHEENDPTKLGPQRAQTGANVTLAQWQSKITQITETGLTTYGIDQRSIIAEFSYEEMVYLLVRGERPSPAQSKLLRAVIVSHVSHGITGQSTIAVRAAVDCGSDFLHALIGGLSVGAGKYHQGGLRAAMEEIDRYRPMSPAEVERDIERRLAQHDRIIGFGHRFFRDGDPRARQLIEIADESGLDLPHVRTAKRMQEILLQRKGLRMNIEAAGGAILRDLGFPAEIGHLVIVIGRSPMLAAAYLERLAEQRPPFQKIAVYDVQRADNDTQRREPTT